MVEKESKGERIEYHYTGHHPGNRRRRNRPCRYIVGISIFKGNSGSAIWNLRIVITIRVSATSEKVLEHLRFLFPDEAQIAIDYASVLIELGEEEDALDLLLTIDESAPEYPQSLLILADYYQMQGLYEVAEKRINEALEILPDEPLIRFAKAELLVEMGRFTEAARIYEELHKQQKEIAGVLLAERLAEVYRAGEDMKRRWIITWKHWKKK